MADSSERLTTSTPTTAVLLAAGAGTRLGLGPKALLPFRGRTLVEVLADVLIDGGCRDVVVVLGADSARVRAATDLRPYTVVENPDWATGMGGSFRAGVAAAAPVDHVLIALVDQPGLSPEAVARLVAAHRPGRVTAAAYRDAEGKLQRGHPLLLDAGLRAEAAETATGDAGARAFLQAHPDLVDLVDCSDLSGGEDLDSPDQLHLLDPGPD
ncbi:nicotine blue oxidoreductase [Arthrobacter sp. NPDC056886]|uniref:nicotine blue oxidoreductase n=1 Tax=Arthrobacter sp. NPDC056886 TaxID=3345960 RepID=UPI00366DE0E1